MDQREARDVGEKAVQYAIWGDRDGSVTIHRSGDYATDYKLSGLEEIAGKTRLMPAEFIASEGNHVTDAFRDYLRPLLGSDMPQAARLRNTPVAKILKP